MTYLHRTTYRHTSTQAILPFLTVIGLRAGSGILVAGRKLGCVFVELTQFVAAANSDLYGVATGRWAGPRDISPEERD